MKLEPTTTDGANEPVPSPGSNGRARTEPTAPDAPPRPGAGRDTRSLGDLLKELSGEGAELVRQEVALAKAEMHQKVDVFGRNLVTMAVGGTFLLAALLLATWTVNTGLTALLAEAVAVEVAVWLAPLILTVALAAAGWGMIAKARNAMSDEGLAPDMTRRTIEEDARWAGRKAREMKEEIQHG